MESVVLVSDPIGDLDQCARLPAAGIRRKELTVIVPARRQQTPANRSAQR